MKGVWPMKTLIFALLDPLGYLLAGIAAWLAFLADDEEEDEDED
jgi:hypothetical protein